MPQQIFIAEQLRIAALLKDERIDELIVAQGRYQIGDIFLGTVENVLPGIDAAFVNIGESEKNGFIHVTDLGPLRLKKAAAGITELLEPRQQVLVQVMKEPTGNKGPRLTGNISLPGRYLVLQPHGQGVNISRRITSEGERNRLRALGVLIKPPGNGLLIRSEANSINEELLINDLESLLQQWEAIQQASESFTPPVLLNRDEDFIHRVLRDHINPDLARVVVDQANAVERINEFLTKDGKQNVLVEAHNGSTDFLQHFRINSVISDALRPRVDLPSGGYIIIEPTEALTVIDVNSGSFTRSANSRETVLWTNCEAAIEIARQLKLRNIGGVIIIDFIDMESRRDQLQLLEHFTSAVKEDSARPQIAQLTELGLVELTRKRQGQNIYELFGKACQHCGGLGLTPLLPGHDLLQPMAKATGLVRSSSLSRSDEQVSANNNNLRRNQLIRNRSNEITSIPIHAAPPSGSSFQSPINETTSEATTNDVSGNRQDPELIGVRMDSEQEEVFSFLGLNPVLLLDQTPSNENFLVRIVRQGEEIETVLEEAKKQLTAAVTRRRKRGKGGGTTRVINRSNSEARINLESANPMDDDEAIESSQNEIKPKVVPETNNSSEETQSIQNLESSEPEEGSKSDQEIEDPRRRRRRSSASNESDS